MAEVAQVLITCPPGKIDWVTLVGSGEPTLHTGLGWLIREVKELTQLPVAVITNGSLLYLPEVRDALSAADAVLPSLDAGTPQLFRKINRPHPESTFERLLEGQIEFRQQYHGQMWVEVMMVGDQNDSEQELYDIAAALKSIQPDQVHIVLPTRPPVETWVHPPDAEKMMRAQAILGDVAQIVHPIEGIFDLNGNNNLADAILAIITRHPMREEELERTLMNWPPDEVIQGLADLRASGRAQIVERYGIRFWSSTESYFPDQAQSLRTQIR